MFVVMSKLLELAWERNSGRTKFSCTVVGSYREGCCEQS